MALRSTLFAGDAKLLAAATSDPAHILSGAQGPHVSKIQQALNTLDKAGLILDGKFGPRTAAAVLAYKRARQIINRSYQSAPDAIVGKMTVAAMDAELCGAPARPLQLRVIAPMPMSQAHRPNMTQTSPGNPLSAFAFSPTFGAPTFNPGPIVEINRGQAALVEVLGGRGALIGSEEPQIASIRDPNDRTAALTHITADPQTIEVVGNRRGGAAVVALMQQNPMQAAFAVLTVSVKDSTPTPFTPTMAPHDHRPTGRWNDLLGAIDQPRSDASGVALYALCVARADPETFVASAMTAVFRDKPVALVHLYWYLRDGRGQEFNEDANIEGWVRADAGIRSKIMEFVNVNRSNGLRYTGFIAYWQADYKNEDYRYAFGSIDRLDIAVDWVLKTVKLWFMDSYEWHPVCPGFYEKKDDDFVRTTNSMHAALVEMKSKGAADYWMVGEATMPMWMFGFPP